MLYLFRILIRMDLTELRAPGAHNTNHHEKRFAVFLSGRFSEDNTDFALFLVAPYREFEVFADLLILDHVL